MSREITVKVKGKNGKEYIYKREVPLPKPRGRHALVYKKRLRAEITKMSDEACKHLLEALERLKEAEVDEQEEPEQEEDDQELKEQDEQEQLEEFDEEEEEQPVHRHSAQCKHNYKPIKRDMRVVKKEEQYEQEQDDEEDQEDDQEDDENI